jgi:hypothetical protein
MHSFGHFYGDHFVQIPIVPFSVGQNAVASRLATIFGAFMRQNMDGFPGLPSIHAHRMV